MTDKEIIKALEEYRNSKIVQSDNGVISIGNILDLINRQQAEIESITEKFNCQQTVYADLSKIIKEKNTEIERLNKENTILSRNADTAFQDGLNEAQELYAEEIKSRVKTEAIKEFAENCKKGLRTGEIIMDKSIRDIIDNLVKETVGDTE